MEPGAGAVVAGAGKVGAVGAVGKTFLHPENLVPVVAEGPWASALLATGRLTYQGHWPKVVANTGAGLSHRTCRTMVPALSDLLLRRLGKKNYKLIIQWHTSTVQLGKMPGRGTTAAAAVPFVYGNA